MRKRRPLPGWARAAQFLIAPIAVLSLAGCGPFLTATTGDVAGIASAGIANGVTKSPAAATGIGLGVAAGANAGLQYVERRVHQTEQDNIAAAAGQLTPGQVAPWRVAHTLPIESNEHGSVAVTQAIDGPEFHCKGIVFSIDSIEDKRPGSAFYTATICNDAGHWKWATAEPATERWGALQ